MSPDDTAPNIQETVRFGPFVLHPSQRVLLAGDSPVPLGSRALDILCLLVERPGELVSKDEIMAKVWPDTIVVEGGLRVHVAGLRKALGDGREGQRYIVTVPNRGYGFVAPVWRGQSEGAAEAVPAAPSAPAMSRSLPVPLHRIIGRTHALETLTRQIARRRLVTVVGAGGIGKTTLAVMAAATLIDQPELTDWRGVHFVDLATLADPRLVPSALASALGLAAIVEDALPSLLSFLHDKALLILFDNCEHVISAVASLAEAILRGAPKVRILATSREPLRAEGEWVQHLQPLTIPAATSLCAGEVLSYSAIELFAERAAACSDTFSLRDEDVSAVVDICRRLDGIPLALELAAARVDTLSIGELAAALDDRFALLTKGRRTALPRHRTLRATLDWSFNLLPGRDSTVLQRLAVFTGVFTQESAVAVAAWGGLTQLDIIDSISDLAARSLVMADVSRDETFFRLLDTTRAYAREMLAQNADAATLRRRHAEYILTLLKRAGAEWSTSTTAQWLASFGWLLDDVRSGLGWAFSLEGDAELGIEMTTKAAPLLFHLSFADECRKYAERALEAASRLPAVSPKLAFELNVVFGHVVFHTLGIRPETVAAFKRALELAEAAQDPAMLAMAYSTNWMGNYNLAEGANMMHFARLFEEQTQPNADPALALMYDRMKAPALHFLGKQCAARECAERSLRAPMIRPSFLTGSQIDRRVSMGAILGRVLWLQGYAQAAEQMSVQTVDIAAREGESVALAFALAFCACPVAIWNGELELASERAARLVRHTAEHSLVAWQEYGALYQLLLSARGDPAARGELISRAHLAARNPPLMELLTTLDPDLVTDAAIARAESGRAQWCLPEILRSRALHSAAADPALTETLLLRAIEKASHDDALAWELRSSIALARMWIGRGRGDEAANLLTAILDRLRDDHPTADVKEAIALRRSLP
jgi:predicted ATPase/DNA-binding winged helix-turn-helix (wHTH) protein